MDGKTIGPDCGGVPCENPRKRFRAQYGTLALKAHRGLADELLPAQVASSLQPLAAAALEQKRATPTCCGVIYVARTPIGAATLFFCRSSQFDGYWSSARMSCIRPCITEDTAWHAIKAKTCSRVGLHPWRALRTRFSLHARSCFYFIRRVRTSCPFMMNHFIASLA